MNYVIVQKYSQSLSFPDSSTSFSTVPWACLAETHQESQDKTVGMHPSVSTVEISGQDTWAPDHESLRGNSQQNTASATSVKCVILLLSHINVAFKAAQACNIFNWKVKWETWKDPRKRFISLYSNVIWVCGTQLQAFLDAIYSQWVLKASRNPYFLLFMQDYSIQHLHPCFLIAAFVDLCKWFYSAL